MDWITDGIALGSWTDACDHRYLEQQGIEAVLQLYGPEPCPDGFPFAKEFLQLDVRDARPLAPEMLRRGVDFIRAQREMNRPLLVCCGAGMSRSPTFLAAYLHEEGLDLLEAYRTIQARRRNISPHPELLDSLVEFYGLPVTGRELLVALVRARAAR